MVKTTLLGRPDFSGYLRANPFHLFYNDRIFDADLYGDGLASYLPASGKSAGRIILRDTYVEPVFGAEDFTLTVKVILTGDFSRKDGEWSGAVDKITFKADGVIKGALGGFDGDLELRDFSHLPPGAAWDAFALDGFKGRLSGNSDYAGLSNGDDVVEGGRGHDTINGGQGNDRLFGGPGDDTLWVSNISGHNLLDGGAGRDHLAGGFNTGNLLTPDILRGGGGADVLDMGMTVTATGGRGADTFKLTSTRFYDSYYIHEAGSPAYYAEDVGSIITDFNRRQGDMLEIDSFIVFDLPEEARYRARKDFSATGRFEVRMQDGVVEVDADGDGNTDVSVWLEGHDTFRGDLSDWMVLPGGMDLI
ncbi:calcium-binding protein [Pseudodonghicola flavimaris]|uniref:Calcium-binding protein n=1 Tax=Pseudodonghicola flavimaris TaxID=3050036 RepID=A0ABT7F254_9RHOB|nr:hypothetical protein [Pseudodonghicola flavimaris]MDK3018686.1 hypothetical protein [Pseudodonghicola flavimaris]